MLVGGMVGDLGVFGNDWMVQRLADLGNAPQHPVRHTQPMVVMLAHSHAWTHTHAHAHPHAHAAAAAAALCWMRREKTKVI